MSKGDLEYLVRYKPNALYTVPAKNGQGAYATLVGDSEEVIGEIDVTPRCKLAVSAFYVRERADFGTIKLTKLQYHARHGWKEVGQVQINQFQVAQMREFVAVLSSLDLRDAKKTRISLDNIDVGALGALLMSNKGVALVKELAEAPELHNDIYAVAAKRSALNEFETLLSVPTAESTWQSFFERNSWIFGHGLNYIFLSKVGPKLETVTTGSRFDQRGKRAHALLRTKAQVSQYVFVEIKANSTQLLHGEYRPGCWGVSGEMSNAVTQVQKTVFEFSRQRFRDYLKDSVGEDTGEKVYSIEPRSYLVIGSIAQLDCNDDKIACFELYRRNVRAPEIITFDELFARARCIVETISEKVNP